MPLWLDEGIAQWEEEAKRQSVKKMVKELFNKDSLLLLDDMMKLDIRTIKEKDKLYIRAAHTKKGDTGILFLSGDNLINLYYVQAVSLVGVLIEKYGSYSFADFCRQLRDGKDLEEALRFAYPTQFRTIDDLETVWREYLQKSE